MVDSKTFSDFFRTTPDGRVALGKGGGLLNFGSRIGRRYEGASRRRAALREVLGRINPSLAGLDFASTWSGPIDRTRNGLPLFGRLSACPDVFYGYGFSGNGVVPCRLGGRILSALLRDTDDAWATCGLVRGVGRDFPPEPIRYVGGTAVRAAIERKDRLADKGREPGPLTRRLAALGPASFKPTA